MAGLKSFADHKVSINEWFILFVAFVLVLYSLVSPMEVDSAQYAEMSREIARQGLSLEFFDKGTDYLDKPPMLFWLSALSIKLFGVHHFAFKLPSVLICLLACYFFYKYICLFYEKTIASLAVVILLSTMAFFHMTNDIRCDALLMSFNVISIYFLSLWWRQQKVIDLLWCICFIALGMMTKGMIALILPAIVYVYCLIINKKWNLLFKWEYIPALILLVLMLLPMSIGLYRQFDMHPEKIVNGHDHVSGLRFFYWTQSFGRITGESVWNNNAGFFYLANALTWQLLPYTILLIYSIVLLLKQKKIGQNWINDPFSVPIVVFGYLMLASSKYQLPHYIYIVFPYLTLFIAIVSVRTSYSKFWRTFQLSFLYLMILFVLFILLFSMPMMNLDWAKIILSVILLGFIFYTYYQKKMGLIHLSAFVSLTLHVLIASIFYIHLLEYQRGNLMADYIQTHALDKSNISYYGFNGMHSLDYNVDFDFPVDTELKNGRMYILDANTKQTLDQKDETYTLMHTIQSFGVSNLSGRFLDPSKRSKVLSEYYLIGK